MFKGWQSRSRESRTGTGAGTEMSSMDEGRTTAGTETNGSMYHNPPTPFNTVLSTTSADQTLSYGANTFQQGVSDPSIRPSLAASASAQHSSYSTRSTSHLLPYTPPVREVGLETIMPHSDKSIPAPPTIAPPRAQQTADAEWASSLGSKSIHEERERALPSMAVGNTDDKRLQQLGYDAVLGRDYTFWSSLAISWMNIGSIQGSIAAVRGAYNYGGPLMILVMWPLSGCWTIFLTLSLAELASVYPVSGAMASWAWKMARGGVGWERWWAWLMGGSVLGGHVANVLLVTWQLTDIIQGIMELAIDYQRKSWQSVLFFLAILLVTGVVGSQAWGRSHRFWLGAGLYGVVVWAILCIALLATGASKTPRIQAPLWMNETGWTSKPYVFVLGWSYCTIASGHDASAHMAEETQNPSRNVPNAMVAAMALTYVAGMISIALLLLSIGPDDVAVIKSHSFPVGYILSTAINRQASIGICTLLVFCLTIQILAQLQASSRFVFALARDNAMPFAATIARTNDSKQPIVAHWLVVGMCVPFASLVVAGRGPLYSVLAVTASTLSYLGYTTPVLLYLLSGKDLQNEGRSSWSLRSRSKIIATVGVVYGLTVIAVSMAPGSWPVTSVNISWSPVILVGTVVVCLITWYCYGIKHYSGPIRAVTKWETGIEIDLQSAIASQRSRPSNNNRSRSNPSDRDGSKDMKADKVHGEYGGSNVVVAPAASLERDSDSNGTGSGGGRTGRTVELRDASTMGTQTGMTGVTGTGRASSRNIEPILEQLSRLLDGPDGQASLRNQRAASSMENAQKKRRILEIGSYPYEHIRRFAEEWPEVEWWGSGRDEQELAGIRHKLAEVQRPTNLQAPVKLDVAHDADWRDLSRALSIHTASSEASSALEGIIMINIVHCCPADLPSKVFEHAATSLVAASGRRPWIAMYSPWLEDDGSYKSASDEQFDKGYIRAKHPSLGLRTIPSVAQAAGRWGYACAETVDMPRGNTWVVWRPVTSQ